VLEDVIARGRDTFIQVGKALLEIRDSRLYMLRGYRTFDAYLAAKWQFTRRHADRLVQAFDLATRRVAAGLPPPANERQARFLLEEESRARRLPVQAPAPPIVNGHFPEPIVNGHAAVNVRARVNGQVQAPALPPPRRADTVPVVDDRTPRGFFSPQRAEQIGQVLDQLKTLHRAHPEALQLTEILRLYWSELCTKVPNGSLIRRAWL
jgi:hypothetical protein